VKRLLWKLERHYIEPVHGMFRLPLPHYRIGGQFHFSMAQTLLSAVAGLSTTLYSTIGGNGARFRGIIVGYYPFDEEPKNAVSADLAADTLWAVLRNPLAHDLGFDLAKKAKTPEIKVLRNLTKSKTRGLSELAIEALERPGPNPLNDPTLQIRSDATVLCIDALYRGVRRLTERIVLDGPRVAAAETALP
jgi:hypothetical protein